MHFVDGHLDDEYSRTRVMVESVARVACFVEVRYASKPYECYRIQRRCRYWERIYQHLYRRYFSGFSGMRAQCKLVRPSMTHSQC